MDKNEARALLEKQEEMLRFDNFTNEDAWALGCLFKEEIEKRNIDFLIRIARPNGHILFQYSSKNAQMSNQHWTECKFRTTSMTGGSSILMGVKGPQNIFGFSELEYAFSGGAFPVKTKDGELRAVVSGSGLPHIKDHAFLVETIAKFLGVENVPVYEGM